MKLIKPYTSVSQAIDSLDNGGQFYDFFTQADDDIISSSEIGKVAGAAFQKQKAVLFLQLALSKLSARERLEVEGRFDDHLSAQYDKFRGKELIRMDGFDDLKLASAVFVRGIPKKIEEVGYVTGFIMVPVIDVFSLIPITDAYTVYQLFDEENNESFLIAHDKEAEPLPEKEISVAGLIKQFQISQDEESEIERFIEVTYYFEN
ncbi:hypothetical protein ACFRAE_14465 [Sphingobacterium sp. HJSM2_6]|uniref:hypothetical protein n=1 Tax=Sphingobacterium sp. HJSM2_6 TaxID=3366264 RepID=UPI003BE049BC